MATKKATKGNNELAKPELFTSNDVPSMIKALEEKLKGFAGITESAYRTSGVIDGIGDIKTITDLPLLIKAAGIVTSSERLYNEGAGVMGLETFPQYSYKGNTVKDWLLDIKLRYDLINQKETIDTLNSFKKDLEGFMTEQDKKAVLMGRMQEFLAKAGL